MNIVICDDELNEVEQLYGLIHKKCKQENCQVELRGFTKPAEFLDYTKAVHIDIAILDIYMDTYHGIDVARELRKTNPQCDIIFVTTSLDNAIDAFEVKASHYLVKPVNEEQLYSALARTTLFVRPPRTITVVSDYINTAIELDNITYIQMLDKCAVFYLQHGHQLKTYTPLKNICNMLADAAEFITAHRNIIINAKYVTNFTRQTITMQDNFSFDIPQKRYAEVKKQYMDYLFSTGGSPL